MFGPSALCNSNFHSNILRSHPYSQILTPQGSLPFQNTPASSLQNSPPPYPRPLNPFQPFSTTFILPNTPPPSPLLQTFSESNADSGLPKPTQVLQDPEAAVSVKTGILSYIRHAQVSKTGKQKQNSLKSNPQSIHLGFYCRPSPGD
ncbi:hypothetical protein BC937DRAFT_94422 [Endogone sp. FLAS-F59071]|nr:hypothetical protein BC937DRAFT_94422 [Endogone sp. FLAS-F59071]|eukprot:RUS20774.1 hypothetical protein BC937DRAFT_94422 [Endogone sp. FLAS-F59071]